MSYSDSRDMDGKDDFIENGLYLFKRPNESMETSAKLSVSLYEKIEVPDDYDLFNTVGIDFARRKHAISRYLEEYEIVYLAKYGSFIDAADLRIKLMRCNIHGENLGFKDKIAIFHSRTKLYNDAASSVIIMDPLTRAIWVNIDFGRKNVSIIRGLVQRFSDKGIIYKREKNKTLVLKGIAQYVLDEHGNVISHENHYLNQGIISYITSQTIKSVTKEEPDFIFNLEEEPSNPFVTFVTPNRSKQERLMEFAEFLIRFSNTNKPEENYEIEKNSLLYDFYAKFNLENTRRAIKEKCGEDLLNILLNLIERFGRSKSTRTQDKLYKQIKSLMSLMKRAENNV